MGVSVDLCSCTFNLVKLLFYKLKKNIMDYEKYKEECKEKWLNENSHKSQLVSSNILPMRPDLGFFIPVGKLDISEYIFKEEYDVISKAYFSVIKKMDEHYKNSKQ